MIKGSFNSVQRVDKGKFIRNALIVLAVAAVVIALLLVVHSLFTGNDRQTVVEEAPTPSAVPSTIRYYDPASEESYSTGVNYIMLGQSDGSQIRVDQEGNVYLIDPSGRIIRAVTGQERLNALEQALQIADIDSSVAIALSGLENIVDDETSVPVQLSQADIRAMLEADTREILEDRYGVTIDDFYQKLYDNGFTPDQYYANLESGADMDSLIDTAMLYRDGNTAGSTTESGNPMSASLMSTQDGEGEDDYSMDLPEWMNTGDIMSGLTADMDTLAAALEASAAPQPTERQQMWDMVNRNEEQSAWIEGQQNVELTSGRITNWDLVAGTVVPITLVTGLNTDLPGQVVGLVRQDVYDTLTGSTILIPKGTRLMANYNNSVSFGQKSVQIAWTQMITPDGYVFSLPGFQGVNGQGYSGVEDKYNSHFWSILGGAFLGSVINMATGYTQDQLELLNTMTNTDYATLLTAGMLEQSENFGQQYVNQMISRQPTIEIRTGTQTLLLVNQTINLKRNNI